jgi:hypothetical protein
MDTNIETQVALLNERLATMQRSLDILSDAIIGNGKPGLRREVDAIKMAIAYDEKQIERDIGMARWLVAIAGGSLVLNVLTFFGNLLGNLLTNQIVRP